MLSILVALYLMAGLIVSVHKIARYDASQKTNNGSRLIDFQYQVRSSLFLVAMVVFWPLHVTRR